MCLGFESGKKFVGVTYKREQNHKEYDAMRRKDREVTKQSEIAQILDMCKTACIAMDDEGEPYAVPLSYGYEWKGDDLILYFHCAKEGKKLEILKRNNRVCFTIFSEGELLYTENPCNSGYYFSSVTGNGVVDFIEETVEKGHALQKMFAHQTKRTVEFTKAQIDSVCVFQIISQNYTGKRKAKR